MPITRAMQVAAFKARVAKKKKLALLASGKNGGSQDSTYARFLSPYRYVSDFAYVEDDDHTLIADAQRRLMWGQRLESSSPPFIEQIVLLEYAVERAKPLKIAASEETQRRWQLMLEADNAPPKRARRSDFGVVRGPRVPMEVPTTSRRKNLKRRTREERIADLRAALSRQE